MILVALALLVLGTFGPLTWMASRGSRAASILGGIEAFLFAVGTILTGFAGFILWAMKCDESCDENVARVAREGTWWHTLAAWQWNAQLALAAGAFVASVTALALIGTKRYLTAFTAVVVGLALFCAWALLVAPLGHNFGI